MLTSGKFNIKVLNSHNCGIDSISSQTDLKNSENQSNYRTEQVYNTFSKSSNNDTVYLDIDTLSKSLSIKHVSLTVGEKVFIRTNPQQIIKLISNSPFVEVNSDGSIFAPADKIGKAARTTVDLYSEEDVELGRCEITIVNWSVNRTVFEFAEILPNYRILGLEDSILYFAYGRKLYKTSDSFTNIEYLSDLPATPSNDPMLITPFGYFYRSNKLIYGSNDLKAWELKLEMNHRGICHMFCYFYDNISNTGYIFAGEYTTDSDSRHHVFRGLFDNNGNEYWEVIKTFYSRNELVNDGGLFPAARHIHIVVVDPYTGHLWVGTGDANRECMIFYSEDFGENFNLIGMGSQAWRTLAIWFTDDYVYWNMDTQIPPQTIWRIPRSVYIENQKWPTITPILNNGQTKPEISYYVLKNSSEIGLSQPEGRIFIERFPQALNENTIVVALNDKNYDYREIVSELANGAHWEICRIVNDQYAEAFLMASSPEGVDGDTGEYPGAYRDWRGRIFYIQEVNSKNTIIEEIISVPPRDPEADPRQNRYTRLIPIMQDYNGYVYLNSRNTEWNGIIKARIKISDDY